MTPLAWAYLAAGAALALGVAYALRSRPHLPVPALLVFGLACDVGVRLCGPAPEGHAFVAALILGNAYPWAVLAVAALVLRRRSAPGGADSHGAVAGVPAPQAMAAVSPDACRIVAAAALAYASYCGLLLASRLRGPALARCYVVIQAALAGAMLVTAWRWRKDEGPEVAHEPMPVRGGSEPHPYPLQGGLGTSPLVGAPSLTGSTHGANLPRRAPTATEVGVIVCVAAEVANVPAYAGLPGWVGARSVYVLAYLALCFVQTRALLAHRGGSP